MHRWSLLCQLASWFNAYCLVRTYSNSLEALCTVLGVYYWLLSLRQQTATTSTPQQPSSPHIQTLPKTKEHQPLQSSANLGEEVAAKRPKCPFDPKHVPRGMSHRLITLPVFSSRPAWLLAASVGVLFRPSSMLFWLPLGQPRVPLEVPSTFASCPD